MTDDVKQFFGRIQLKPAVVSGHITSVTVDQATGQQLSALVSVGGTTIRIRLTPNTALLAAGDQVRLEQYGQAAMAEYRLVGIEAGGRPNSGTLPILNDGTVIGGTTYLGGDLILGKIDEGNIYVEYATGRMFHRIGSEVYGIDYADGSRLFGHAVLGADWEPDGPNVLVDANGVWLRDALSNVLTLDSTNGIQMFSGVEQRVSIEPDGSGWLGGSDKLSWDTAGNMTLAGSLLTGAGTIFMNEDGFWLGDPDTGASLTLNEVKDVYGAGTGSFGLRIYDQEGVAHLSLLSRASNTPYFRLGAPDADTWLQWDENGLELKGTITATDGQITGALYVGAAAPRILIDGTNKLIESTNYVAGFAGFRMSGVTGSAEFEDITARGAIKTAVFQKSLVTAFAGSQVVSKSASTVAVAVTLSGTIFPLVVRAQDGAPFADGDLIYIKTETLATYAIVNAGTASGDNWAYTATYHSGSNSGTVPVGATVVDYGPNGAGRVYLTADATSSPYLSIATHDMAAPPVWTERVRLGNLSGISGASGYGLWTDNGWFTGTVTASVIRSAATGARIEMNTERILGIDDVGNVQWYAQASNGKLYAGGGAVVLDASGMQIDVSSDDDTVFSFLSDDKRIAHIGGYIGGLYTGDTRISSKLSINADWVNGANTAMLSLRANGETDDYVAYINVFSGDLSDDSYIALTAESTVVSGDLVVTRNTTNYTGYISVPLTSSRRNNTYFGSSVALSVGTYYPDLHDANYNLPAGIKGIYCRLSAKWGAAGDGNIAIIRPKGGSDAAVVARAQAANIHIDSSGFVPCDANGDIEIQIMGATTTAFWLDVWGYVI
jgi:hypothetical protein